MTCVTSESSNQMSLLELSMQRRKKQYKATIELHGSTPYKTPKVTVLMRFGSEKVRNLSSSEVYPSCQIIKATPIEKSRPIILKELKLEVVNKGNFLACQVLISPYTQVITRLIVSGRSGTCAQLNLAHFTNDILG